MNYVISTKCGVFDTAIGARVLGMALKGEVKISVRDANEFLKYFPSRNINAYNLCDKINACTSKLNYNKKGYEFEFLVMDAIRSEMFRQESYRTTRSKTPKDSQTVISESTDVNSIFSRQPQM